MNERKEGENRSVLALCAALVDGDEGRHDDAGDRRIGCICSCPTEGDGGGVQRHDGAAGVEGVGHLGEEEHPRRAVGELQLPTVVVHDDGQRVG